jgi:nitrogen fixation protein NifU and related proteins
VSDGAPARVPKRAREETAGRMSAHELENIYHRTILERARHPRHQHRLEPFDAEAREVNPLCGDRVTLRLTCDATTRIVAVGYEARACAICMASSDFMAELVPGMLAAGARLAAAEFERGLRSGETAAWHGRMAVLSLFAPLHEAPSRIGCATLPWKALGHALVRALATEGDGHG